MRKTVLAAGLLSVLITNAQAGGPLQDPFPADMKNTLGIYPLSFTDSPLGCRCSYVVKNTTDATLTKFQARVVLHGDKGSFPCDIGMMSDPVEPGEIQKLSNIALRQKCGKISEAEYSFVSDCTFDNKGWCSDEQTDKFVLLPYKGVHWTQD